VYSYASAGDGLYKPGPTLTIATGQAWRVVRVTGSITGRAEHWTTSTCWGRLRAISIIFDKPGRHTVEIVDVVPAT
jgi:hypothetical protein